jgi:hypothetical protein
MLSPEEQQEGPYECKHQEHERDKKVHRSDHFQPILYLYEHLHHRCPRCQRSQIHRPKFLVLPPSSLQRDLVKAILFLQL